MTEDQCSIDEATREQPLMDAKGIWDLVDILNHPDVGEEEAREVWSHMYSRATTDAQRAELVQILCRFWRWRQQTAPTASLAPASDAGEWPTWDEFLVRPELEVKGLGCRVQRGIAQYREWHPQGTVQHLISKWFSFYFPNSGEKTFQVALAAVDGWRLDRARQ